MKSLKRKAQKRNNKGFSLVELIIVIAIMAVLIAVLAPQFIKYVDRSRQSNDATMVSGIVTAVQTGVSDVTEYDINPATYTVTITSTGTSVAATNSADTTDFEAAIVEACGDLNTIRSTANKWKSEGIIFTSEVTSEGKVIVKYTSPLFKDYIEKASGSGTTPAAP